MEFRILGPADVRSDAGVPLALSRPRLRAALCVLLLQVGRPVTLTSLTDALWGIEPPGDPRGALRSCVYGLRKAAGLAGRLHTLASGYVLQLHGDDQLDLLVFRDLAGEADDARTAGDHAKARNLLRQALDLWREPPLVDLPAAQSIEPVAAALLEQRRSCEEALVDAELSLGRHNGLLPSLAALTAAEPLREQRWGQLMLALYRCGRQAEALDAYTKARAVLAHECGLDPGPGLQQLHRRILAADPSLAPRLTAIAAGAPEPVSAPAVETVSAAAPGAVLMAAAANVPMAVAGTARVPETSAGGQAPAPGTGNDRPAGFEPHRRAEPKPLPVATRPNQLPTAVRHLVGRRTEARALFDLMEEARNSRESAVISVLTGPPGVGKSTLAVYFARHATERFPDGQLYVNLRGFEPSGHPLEPAEAVSGFLEALGVPPQRVPESLEIQSGVYRSLMAEKRMLILLDNARDSAHVRPMLPAGSGSMVVVTSRCQLTSLVASEDAHLITLDVLSQSEARELLTSRLGPRRAAAEPAAVSELSELCARLPLALTITAARAAAHPGLPLTHLVAELREHHHQLDALNGGEPASDIRSAFSWSYESLTAPAARMFRLLGLHHESDISLPVAAGLANLPVAKTHRVLRELTTASLLTEPIPGRYRLPHLLRAYATERALAEDVDTEGHHLDVDAP